MELKEIFQNMDWNFNKIKRLKKENPTSFDYEISKVKGIRIYDPYNLMNTNDFRNTDGWTHWTFDQ